MQKEVLKLAIPNVISNVVVPLLGLVDMAVMGHLNEVKYLGGVALGVVVFNFIYWNFAFLRMGSSGLTAQAFGARNHEECSLILSRALVVGLVGAVMLIACQTVIDRVAFNVLDGSPEVKELAREYFYIRIYAAPATIGMYALTGWFIGMQNSMVPMIVSIAVNATNIVLNLFFVYRLGMKTDGVALGSLVAQYLGLVLCLVFLLGKYRHMFRGLKPGRVFIRAEFVYFFKVNADIFIRTLFVILVMTFFTSKSAGINNATLAVNAIFMQLMLTYSFFIDGFAYAAEALVGKYTGARDRRGLLASVKVIFGWAAGISLAMFVLLALFNAPLLSLLTRDAGVLGLSRSYIWWLICVPLVAMFAFVWDGVYIGAAASKGMRNSLIISATVFFVLYFLLRGKLGNHALWLSFYAYLLTRGIYQSLRARKYVFRAAVSTR